MDEAGRTEGGGVEGCAYDRFEVVFKGRFDGAEATPSGGVCQREEPRRGEEMDAPYADGVVVVSAEVDEERQRFARMKAQVGDA